MDPELERRARRVLASSSVLAEVAAGRVEWQTRGAGDRPARPAGNATSLHDVIARRFAGCVTDRDLAKALEWAEEEVADARKAKPRPKIPFKQRVIFEWENHHDLAVARVTNTPRSTIRSYFIACGMNPKKLSVYIGHSDIRTTYNRYGHLMPGDVDQAARQLDTFLEAAPRATVARQSRPQRGG